MDYCMVSNKQISQVAVGSEFVSENRASSEQLAKVQAATRLESSNVAEEPFIREESPKNLSKQGQQEVVQLSIFDDEQSATVQPTKTVIVEDKPARELIRHMKEIDVMNMTPLQAMQILNELKLKAQQLS